jgi:hypothetical protein
VSEAIFGLIGVVVGALATGGVEYWMAWRRERAELKQAKRLVAEELESLKGQLSTILRENRTPDALPPDVQERFLPTSTWLEYRAILARRLDDAVWYGLPHFYSGVSYLRLDLLRDPAARPLDDWTANQVKDMATLAGRVRGAPG